MLKRVKIEGDEPTITQTAAHNSSLETIKEKISNTNKKSATHFLHTQVQIEFPILVTWLLIQHGAATNINLQ